MICAMTVLSMSVSSFAVENMQRGSRGDDVKEMQEMLISSGYLAEGEADGIFGAKTEKAVLAFQQEKGLDATGIVGEGTYNMLKQGDAEQEEAAPAEEAEAAQTEETAPAEVAAPAEEAEVAEEAAAGDVDIAETFPSWNPDSENLTKLVDFVKAATDESGDGYIDPADRIATFDMDGTILCERAPVYMDWCLTMYRVLDDPTFNATEEERAVMQEIREHTYTYGETYTPESGLTKDDIVSTAFAGMTPAEFRSYVRDFAAKVDVVGFEGMTYGESFYRPMLEVIAFLKANDFDVWMVSACEREVVRAVVEQYDIPFDHVIATDVPYVAAGKGDEDADEYNMSLGEEIVLGAPLDSVECGKSGKPAAIIREIGRQPVLTFGNSSGDFSMLNFAQSNPDHAGMGVLIVNDDTVREYGNDEKAAEFYAEAEKQGWTAISMANDWKEIYGEGVERTEMPGVEEEEALADAA